MSCPRCQKPLVEIFTAAGVILDVCGSCHGTWFDRGELVAFAADKKRFAKQVDAGLLDRRSSKLACPRCSDNLEEGGLLSPELVVDECPHCRGFWVDRPMLEKAFHLEGGLGDPHAGHCKPELLNEVDHVDGQPAGPASALGGALAGAAAMAMPALPSMLLRSALVIGGLYAMLFVFLLAMTLAAGGAVWIAVAITVGFAALQFGIAPAMTDWVLGWCHQLRWVQKTDLPEHLIAFVEKVCKEEGIPFPAVGIIDDGNPNAFTYGHTPRNARLVVTRGLIEVLSPAELEAVVAHELGHVVHVPGDDDSLELGRRSGEKLLHFSAPHRTGPLYSSTEGRPCPNCEAYK